MNIEMTKGKKVAFLATICLAGVLLVADAILTPTVYTLYELYANQLNLVNFIVTGYYLVAIIASLIAGKLCEKLSKKAVMVIGAINSTLCAFAMMYSGNIVVMTIGRALHGIGYGFTMTAIIGLILDVFPDEAQSSKYIGYQNASMTIISVILSSVAGNLASVSVKTSYLLHWTIPVYLFSLLLFVPSIKPEKVESAKESKDSNTRFGKRYWLMVLNYFVLGISIYVMAYYGSLYFSENALGDDALSGYFVSVFSFAGLPSVLFGKIYERLKNRTYTIAAALGAIAMLLFRFVPNTVIAFIAMVLCGFCLAMACVYMYAFVPSAIPAEASTDKAVSVVTSISTLSACLTGYFITFGMSVLKMETVTSFVIVPAVLLAACSLVALIVEKEE